MIRHHRPASAEVPEKPAVPKPITLSGLKHLLYCDKLWQPGSLKSIKLHSEKNYCGIIKERRVHRAMEIDAVMKIKTYVSS